jgi:hypothetical protein
MSDPPTTARLFRHPAARRWLLVAVLLGAMAVYLHGFLQTLPYQLEPDEPNIWLWANALVTRGEFTSWYPPLRLIEISLEHRLLYLITPPGQLAQPVYYVTGRLFSVLYGLLLLSLTYQAGRRLHSPAAGIAAMLFLIAQPDAARLAKLMKVETFAWMFGMAALLLTFLAIRKGPRWLIWPALLAGLAAAASKYTMGAVLIVPGLALIFVLPRNNRIRALAALAAAAVVVAGVLIVLHPPPPIESFFLRFHVKQLYNRGGVFQFDSLIPAWPQMVEQVGLVNLVGLAIGLPLAMLVWPRERISRQRWSMIAFTLVMMVTTYLALGMFRTNRPQDRYAIVLGFALLWGVTLAALLKQRAGLAVIAALVLLGPWIARDWREGTRLRLPDTRAMTAEWFIANAPEGTKIAAEKDYVEFERAYGGFPSEKIFFVQEIDSVYDQSLEEFARQGIEYLIADYRNIYRGGFYEPGRDNSAFLSQVETVLDLDEPWNHGWQGPSRFVFRIPPIQQHPRHVFLGDAIIFKGFDLGADTVSPGDTLDLTLYWAALRETDANYIVFAHLEDGEGTLVAQLDGPPGDALHRTYDWWPGYFDWDEWPLAIPAETPPGSYTLLIGMYDADTLQRLPAVNEDGTPLGDHIVLGEISVVGD